MRGTQGKRERVGRRQPSHFCHICASKSAYKKSELVHCANLNLGKCTKSFCEECFERFSWDWDEAKAGLWECVHCRGVCPPAAQCLVYHAINRRIRDSRRIKSKNGAHRKTVRASSSVTAGTPSGDEVADRDGAGDGDRAAAQAEVLQGAADPTSSVTGLSVRVLSTPSKLGPVQRKRSFDRPRHPLAGGSEAEVSPVTIVESPRKPHLSSAAQRRARRPVLDSESESDGVRLDVLGQVALLRYARHFSLAPTLAAQEPEPKRIAAACTAHFHRLSTADEDLSDRETEILEAFFRAVCREQRQRGPAGPAFDQPFFRRTSRPPPSPGSEPALHGGSGASSSAGGSSVVGSALSAASSPHLAMPELASPAKRLRLARETDS